MEKSLNVQEDVLIIKFSISFMFLTIKGKEKSWLVPISKTDTCILVTVPLLFWKKEGFMM